MDVFSNDFWVIPCEPGACDRRLAQETAARYKAAAGQMADAWRAWGRPQVLDQGRPGRAVRPLQERAQHAVKAALEDAPLYKRVIADKITRKLEFATRVPSGPHGMALAIAHQVSADALEMYLDIVHDPPAPYDTVAQPEFDVPGLRRATRASTG